jgi:hypothetical protein
MFIDPAAFEAERDTLAATFASYSAQHAEEATARHSEAERSQANSMAADHPASLRKGQTRRCREESRGSGPCRPRPSREQISWPGLGVYRPRKLSV